MDINDNLDSNFNAFSLNSESRDYLITSAKWAKIISIISFISIGVGLLAMIGFVSFGEFLFGDIGLNNFIGLTVVIYFVVFIIFMLTAILPFYMLYKFAIETNANLIEFKGGSLFRGIRYLNSFFKTTVLFILITTAFYFITILFAISYSF